MLPAHEIAAHEVVQRVGVVGHDHFGHRGHRFAYFFRLHAYVFGDFLKKKKVPSRCWLLGTFFFMPIEADGCSCNGHGYLIYLIITPLRCSTGMVVKLSSEMLPRTNTYLLSYM